MNRIKEFIEWAFNSQNILGTVIIGGLMIWAGILLFDFVKNQKHNED